MIIGKALTAVSLIAIFSIFLILISFKLGHEEWTPWILTLSSFMLTGLNLSKNELLPPDLFILSGGTVFFIPNLQMFYSIILSITFINKGYGDIVIECVYLKVINERNQERLYFSLQEDKNNLTKAFQNDYELAPFSPFYMTGQQSLSKGIAFYDKNPNDYSNLFWESSKHRFEIYIKVVQNNNPNIIPKLAEFERVIRPESLANGRHFFVYCFNEEDCLFISKM